MYPIVQLKRGREKSLLRRHPWVFSGAVKSVERKVEPGGLVFVESDEKAPLGTGYFNPRSDIRIRIVDFKERTIDREFFVERIRQAAALRKRLSHDDIDAWRLINSEGDFLPGLIVDQYADGLVVSVSTLGMECLREAWLTALKEVVKPSFIYERSEKDQREAGSAPKSVRKTLHGQIPDGAVEFQEKQCRYWVDVEHGQKTGFYLDQRESRSWVLCLSRGRKVLNLFSYSGGFTIPALKGNATSVTSVDTSRPALELLEKNLSLNGLDPEKSDAVEGNAFDFLRQCPKETYDLVIVDPPPLCRKRSDTVKAARAYKDVNRLAFRAARPGAYVFTYSCSHYFQADLFGKVIYQAAVEAGRELRILHRFSHPVDHPISVYHPEGEYFKGLLLGVS